jgi:arylamine N-acetyltransferase
MTTEEKAAGCSVQGYLDMIGFEGQPRPDFKTLCKLQSLQVCAVPWNNLEILERKPLSLDIPALYNKIVRRRKGGYCFEVNGLFVWLLREIGFNVTEHFGRWLRDETLDYPARRHRSLRIEVEGKQYICDVGAGSPAPREPLLIKFDEVQTIAGEDYKIIKEPNNVYEVQYLSRDGNFKRLYSFNDDPCLPIDYLLPHYYCTTHPESLFLNITLVFIRTPEGHNVISDIQDQFTGLMTKELRIVAHDECKKMIIRTQEDFHRYLQEYFYIDVNA